jgi:predicted transglutaminase-like cysteine proteinase
MFKVLRNAVAGSALAIFGATAYLAAMTPPESSPAEARTVTSNPIGWQDFCLHDPSECIQKSGSTEPLRLTSKSMSVINRINRWVNTWIIPTSDLKQWSREERWSYPDNGNGDCEDYALLKRKMLLEEGFPLQALLLTIVRNPLGDAHAVLMVRTDHGDFVLDNLTDEMLPWARTSYRFIKRQSERNPNVWLKLRNASDEDQITTRQIP